MEVYQILFIFVFFATPLYDFYLLKKENVKLGNCIKLSLVTVALNIIVIIFGGVISDFWDYGSNSFSLLLTSLILFLTYIRLKKRIIINGEIKKNKEVEEKKLTPLEKDIYDSKQAVYLGYVIAGFTAIVVLLTYDSLDDLSYLKFIDILIWGGLAFWGHKKDPFIPLLIMAPLFVVAKFSQYALYYVEGNTGYAGGFFVAAIFIYYLFKGLFSAYRVKFNKY